MFGLDEQIAELGNGSVALALAVAVLLGLRHATDPDHITAVTTLVASDEQHGARRARRLGLAWGLGHATTLFLLGLPVVLYGDSLPEIVFTIAEVAIGVVIVALAVRLLVRWRRGYLHSHVHEHDGVRHAHPHVHEHAPEAHPRSHSHSHDEALGRTPLAAYGIGLVHGVGGSGGLGILLVASVSGTALGVITLILFAGATALSMALVSTAFGHGLTREPVASRLAFVVPLFGALGIAFGAWYALGALEAVPYVF